VVRCSQEKAFFSSYSLIVEFARIYLFFVRIKIQRSIRKYLIFGLICLFWAFEVRAEKKKQRPELPAVTSTNRAANQNPVTMHFVLGDLTGIEHLKVMQPNGILLPAKKTAAGKYHFVKPDGLERNANLHRCWFR